MSKILKITPLLAAMLILTPTFAEYRVNVPLETTQGGRLPDGSISFGDTDNSGNNGETPSANCMYDNNNFIILMTQAQPDRSYQAGDMMFVADSTVISYFSPSNNKFPKPGLSVGKEMETYEDEKYFEICGDNLSNYPPMGGVDQEEEPPVDDHTGPDWTPECILNTSSDYSAIETSTDKYFFNSTSFGLNNYNSPHWYYVPENYDPNNPSSYIYFDKSVQTGEPRVSGPNPNYSYAQICRVRKMEL